MNEDLVEKIDDRIATLKDERERLLAAKAVLRGGVGVSRFAANTPLDIHINSAAIHRSVAEATARRAARTTRRPTRRRDAGGKRPRGEAQQAILDALREAYPKAYPKALTAGGVAAKTGITPGSASTTLTKLARSKQIEKADRGYRSRGG